ncbi:hypothetical protein DMB66_14330 [Actinoplanes sp. ATCC 53533]|nr:hypothetical protein DMB66_14330 [Actinoplanes sp. ATCC 53533]
MHAAPVPVREVEISAGSGGSSRISGREYDTRRLQECTRAARPAGCSAVVWRHGGALLRRADG